LAASSAYHCFKHEASAEPAGGRFAAGLGHHLVRTGILRVFGANLRQVLAKNIGNRLQRRRWLGRGRHRLVQSSTATA
jgi:hypothetical protein